MRTVVLARFFLLFACVLVVAFAFGQRSRSRFDANWKFHLEPASSPGRNDIAEWMWEPLYVVPNTDAPSIEKALAGSPTEPQNGHILNNGRDTTNYVLTPGYSGRIQATAWLVAHSGEDVFHGRRGFARFHQRLTREIPAALLARTILHFESVDDNATVYLNGKRVLHHEGWNDPFDVPIRAWISGGDNIIDVIVENTDGPGGIGSTRFDTLDAPLTVPKEAKPGFADAPWRTVHLPHDYVIEGTFSKNFDAGHGALPTGTAWYRKTFSLPNSAKRKSVWIDFDGAFSDAKVWFNGIYLGEHRSGYTGFRYDLAQHAIFGGKNVLAVHLDARKTEGWWYEGGGLYRHVWLTVTNPIHISPLAGVYVTTNVGNVTGKPNATVVAQIEIDNTIKTGATCELRSTLLSPSGKVVTTAKQTMKMAGKQTGVTVQRLQEPNAKLWSLEHTAMYTLRTQVLREGRVVDSVDTPFGIRTLRFDPARGFFLNDKPVKLKGTCDHQDFIGVGIGMPDSVLEWRIKRLKTMGSNAYRCSHNEVAPELLDACDRLGMLVMDENRELGDTWTGKANPKTTTNNLSDLRQEIYRDRNHPSVIMWSIGNEEWGTQTDPAGTRIGKALVAVVHGIDPTRPVTAALNGGHDSYFSRTLDLEGFNYGPNGYVPYHNKLPEHPMFASETASTTTTRGIYARDNVRGYVPAYDTQGTDSAEAAWEPIAREPYNEGGFVWTGFDYKGEPSPFGWPCVNSHFGILDMCGFPKDVFYYYKAWWGNEPAVHVFPHWDWAGSEGKPIDVWVFSNGDAVELFLNGRSLGRKQNPPYEHLSWKVPYQPGKLVAKAYSRGKLIASDSVATTGRPSALRVTTTRTKLVGDNEDTTMLEVSVVDSAGRVVPIADNLVSFSLTGPAWVSGVGNGDPSCHEPDRASTRHAFNGWVMGLIQARNKSGTVVVTISSPGLKSAKITLRVSPDNQF